MSSADSNKPTHQGLGSTPQQRHIISHTEAQSILQAATSRATTLNISQNIALVDPSGLLISFLRMDNAYPGSIDISIKKARTCVLFNGLPSGAVYDLAQPGGPFYGIQETNSGLVVFGGGLPLYKDGFLIGGIGVSGGSVEQDLEVAKAGADWLTR